MLSRILALLLLMTTTLAARAAEPLPPLVEVDWLLAQAPGEQPVYLDIQPAEFYRQVHLAGAVSAPFSTWRADQAGGVRGMLPDIASLEAKLGGLGINPDSRVLIINTGLGAADMAAAARVFWTFKVLGHTQVAILNGGLQAVADHPVAGQRLSRDVVAPRPATYKANPDYSLHADAAQTRRALARGELMVDARTQGEFLGVHVAGEGERPGSLPGARNLPFDWLTENGSAEILPKTRVRALLKAVDIDAGAPQVHYCHTGNRAALTWFVAWAMLGNKHARLYDASMVEWSVREDLPLERRVQF